MTPKQRQTQFKPGQSGNPSGRPPDIMGKAFRARAKMRLPEDLRHTLEKGGIKLPANATFADGVALMVFVERFARRPGVREANPRHC